MQAEDHLNVCVWLQHFISISAERNVDNIKHGEALSKRQFIKCLSSRWFFGKNEQNKQKNWIVAEFVIKLKLDAFSVVFASVIDFSSFFPSWSLLT